MSDAPRHVLCRELRQRAHLHGETASILHKAALDADRGGPPGLDAGALRYQSCHHRIRSLECNAQADALEEDGWSSDPFS